MTTSSTDTQKSPRILPFIALICGGRAGFIWFFLMLLAIIASACVTLGFGYVLKNLVDNGFIASNVAELNKSLIILLCMVAGLALAAFTRLSLAGYLSERVATNLRARAFTHLLGQDATYFDTAHSHALSSGLAADTALIQGVLATALPQIIRNALMVLGGLAMLLATSPNLTILVIGILPLVAIPAILLGRKVRKNTRISQVEAEKLGELTGESLSNIQVVQSFGLEGVLNTRFNKAASTALKAAMRQTLTRAFMVSGIILILFASLCVVLWYGAHAVMENRLSAGDLTSFVFYSGLVAAAFGVLGDMGASLYRASAAFARINDIFALTPSVISGTHTPHIVGHIDLDNVGFAYKSHPVLNGLTLSIPAGTTMAIVGASGSGKTTIFKLLMRLYDVTSGQILLDGYNINDMDLAHLRRQIAYVPQDPALFSGTIRENIALGLADAPDDAAVIFAASAAQAHDFIMTLPDKYETLVGERGMTLSGGQRQRIALARALLKPAPILLLDEATAALDTANEQSIQQALRELHGKRTIVIIAHRLSTVMQADKIFVIENGVVVESGTHERLFAVRGLYANMVRSQLLNDTFPVNEG